MSKKPEIIILSGIPGSGKSRYYQKHFSKTHVRINLDMLKTRKREDIFIQACIDAKQSLVIDNTNVTKEKRAKYIDIFKNEKTKKGEQRFNIVGYYIMSDVERSTRHNSMRDKEDRVPNGVITMMHKQLEAPVLEEGFDDLYYVEAVYGEAFKPKKWDDMVEAVIKETSGKEFVKNIRKDMIRCEINLSVHYPKMAKDQEQLRETVGKIRSLVDKYPFRSSFSIEYDD